MAPSAVQHEPATPAPVVFGALVVDPNFHSADSTTATTTTTTTAPPAATLPPLPAVPHSNASTMTTATADAVRKELHVDESNPFSAFYKHPDARRSTDEDTTPTPTKTYLDVYDRDLEAGGQPLSAATTQQLAKTSVDSRVREVKECTMWPSRQAVLDQRRHHKRTKGCNLFKGLTTKQRLWIKIVIALLVVGAAVGLGVGISRAVGGGVWAANGKSREIPHN